MKCFICDKEILPEERKFLYPLDKPYLNLWCHKECYLENDHYELAHLAVSKLENIQNYTNSLHKNRK